MKDAFGPRSDSIPAPGRDVGALVPSDTTDRPTLPKAIYVGTGGDLALIGVNAPASATGVIFRNLPAGALLPVRARRVLATGTMAADLLVVL